MLPCLSLCSVVSVLHVVFVCACLCLSVYCDGMVCVVFVVDVLVLLVV